MSELSSKDHHIRQLEVQRRQKEFPELEVRRLQGELEQLALENSRLKGILDAEEQSDRKLMHMLEQERERAAMAESNLSHLEKGIDEMQQTHLRELAEREKVIADQQNSLQDCAKREVGMRNEIDSLHKMIHQKERGG
eukprot:GDKK01056655.1.p2 GENE.GDKK01056655.1~~GDKK01056655.1.p2  ORF type:complete len:138 (-),score=33.07 GDKK01056655.1:6-419(-)